MNTPTPARPVAFLTNVNLVFLTFVANATLAFGVSVLIARALGPEGRGVYALFLLSASIAQIVLSLGMNVASVYELGKGTSTASRILANLQHVVVLSIVVSGGLVLLAWPLFGDRLLENDAPFWAFAFIVPLFINYNVIATIFQGQNRFQAMNLVILAQPLVLLPLLAVMMSVADVDPTAALMAWSVATLVAVVLALVLLRDHLRLPELIRVDVESLGRQIRFGLKGQIGNLIQLLNYRLDQYVVLFFVNTAAVGIYVVAVTISQSVWFLANAVATVLLPRLTSADDAEAARATPVVCRNTLLATALGAGALAAVSPWLVEGVFGNEFRGALIPLLWLLPGTVALAGSKVLSSYLLSRGRPLTNSWITIVALAVTLIADFALIPPLDVTGAAIASTLAYLVHFALSLLAYQRLAGGSAWDAVIVRRDDIRYLVQAAREQLASVRS